MSKLTLLTLVVSCFLAGCANLPTPVQSAQDMIAVGQKGSQLLTATQVIATQANQQFINSEATRSAGLTATPAALSAEGTALKLDQIRATDAGQATITSKTETAAAPLATHNARASQVAGMATDEAGIAALEYARQQHDLDMEWAMRMNDVSYKVVSCGAALFLMLASLAMIFLTGHVGRDSIRVWSEAFGLLLTKLADNRERVAKARILEASAYTRQQASQASQEVMIPGKEYSPETFRVLHVITKMCDMVGRPSSKLPSARLRASKGLSNTVAQPVINVLIEDGILRAHVDGEEQGLYVNKGINLGGLEALIEGDVLDWSGDYRLVKSAEDIEDASNNSMQLTTS